MKKVSIKIILFFIIISLISIVYAKSVNAAEIASGTCGTNVIWSLDDSGLLTIAGSGEMTRGSSVYKSPWQDYQDKVRSVKFEGDITSIGSSAFWGNNNLEEIIIPDTVKVIGQYAFQNCTNLRKVTFSKNLENIGSWAFFGCTSLEEVDLPEELMYINDYAFGNCTNLKNITIRSEFNIVIEGENTTVPEDIITIMKTATITAYKNTGAFYFARYHGIKFKDLKTGKISQETITKQSYLDIMPTENVKAVGVTGHDRSLGATSDFDGYITDFCYEKDTSNSQYLEIKAKVDELTEGCTTDEEKAKHILAWFENMTYQWGLGGDATIETMYRIFCGVERDGKIIGKMVGNCAAYTKLLNYMLYLADIPVGTAKGTAGSGGHEWTVAFIDEKWIYIDATGMNTVANADYWYGRTYGTTESITFAYNGFIYLINDPSEGLKITGIAKSKEDIKNLTEIVLPNNPYIKEFYKTTYYKTGLGSEEMNLIATKGPKGNPTVGEKFVRENRECCQVVGNQIIGRQYHENYNADTCTRCIDTDAIGDINGDGRVNIIDVGLLNDHVKNKKILTGEELERADIDGNGKVNIIDVGKLNDHVKNKKLLW